MSGQNRSDNGLDNGLEGLQTLHFFKTSESQSCYAPSKWGPSLVHCTPLPIILSLDFRGTSQSEVWTFMAGIYLAGAQTRLGRAQELDRPPGPS